MWNINIHINENNSKEKETKCNETKKTAEKWFEGKDDDWLKMPLYDKMTNFDNTTGQLRHIMYHVGHCEAIFRENGIKTGEYLDYFG